MNLIESFLQQKIDKRKSEKALRTLTLQKGGIDFLSNDYLGISRSKILDEYVVRGFDSNAKEKYSLSGSTGSRLLSGNSKEAEKLERKIASFHHAEAALLFNSGYSANTGIIPAVTSRHSAIIYDELCHASLLDGIRLSHAQRFKFRHNDLDDLRKKILRSKGNRFIVVESIYSMDGDASPLLDLVQVAEETQAEIILDEAHAIGVFGKRGQGLSQSLGVESKIFARIYTYGKAPASHGAAVVGSKLLKTYLTNFARSFIYTTAQPLHAIFAIDAFYDFVTTDEFAERQHRLKKNISFFRNQALNLNLTNSNSPIQAVLINDISKIEKLISLFEKHSVSIKPIFSPTVAKGSERFRICLHSFNIKKELSLLLDIFNMVNGKL